MAWKTYVINQIFLLSIFAKLELYLKGKAVALYIAPILPKYHLPVQSQQ